MSPFPAEWIEARDAFSDQFGHHPTHFAVAPGRVNLIGEHTDYQNGFVLPAAIDLWVIVFASVSDSNSILRSTLQQDNFVFDTRHLNERGVGAWGDYAAGMAWAFQRIVATTPQNILASVSTSLPIGAGLSSSAAMEMAFGTLWQQINGIEISKEQMARLGQIAENEYVGMRCGIMDQTASIFGKEGHAIFVDTADPGNPEPIPLPKGVSLVVCDTRVKHELTGTEYNDRRRESEAAAQALGVETLRDTSLSSIESQKGLDEILKKRARHIVSENARVLAFKDALVGADFHQLGDLMAESHQSLRFDYEVSCPELDEMALAAQNSPGCIGARMMGGGFGGSCIALVREESLDAFLDQAAAAYRSSTGIDGHFIPCKAVDGAYSRALEPAP